MNDYLIRNEKIRVVIQDVQRNLFGIGQFGGQIIDGDIVRSSGPDRDSFEEWALSLNIESTAHYTSISVINDGANGGPAIIRATGVDDLLDFVNPSSTIASFGFSLPPSADDTDIPVTVTTDYILEPGTNYVRVETTVQNTSAAELKIFFGEYINGSGENEMFQSGYGFGEPLVATRCPITPINLCNFTAYMGIGDSDGVSYGYIQQTPGSSTFTTSGVHVPQLSIEVVLALIGAAGPPFTMQPMGDPADSITLTRYFVVADGNVSGITDARNEIQCVPTGTLHGTVTANSVPVSHADIAVLGNTADGPGVGALTRNVLTHTRTDAAGNYSLTLPPGSYTVIANLEGSPYEGGGSSPLSHPIVITAFGTTTQNVDFPQTGALQVTVDDGDGNNVPAKVSIVGFDPSADPFNTQNIAGLINNRTAVFGDRTRDISAFGLSKTLFIGTDGDTGVVPIEPGNYQVVVSRGAEYSLDAQNVTVNAGATSPVAATVEHVIDSTGFISADFHVHSIDSPDSRVPNGQRVLSMLDEGMDFFTPTDHDYRFDYQSTIDSLGATQPDRYGGRRRDHQLRLWALQCLAAHRRSQPGQPWCRRLRRRRTGRPGLPVGRILQRCAGGHPGEGSCRRPGYEQHRPGQPRSQLLRPRRRLRSRHRHGHRSAVVGRARGGAAPEPVGDELLHRHDGRAGNLDRRHARSDLHELPGSERRRLVQHDQPGHRPHRRLRLRQPHHDIPAWRASRATWWRRRATTLPP